MTIYLIGTLITIGIRMRVPISLDTDDDNVIHKIEIETSTFNGAYNSNVFFIG